MPRSEAAEALAAFFAARGRDDLAQRWREEAALFAGRLTVIIRGDTVRKLCASGCGRAFSYKPVRGRPRWLCERCTSRPERRSNAV